MRHGRARPQRDRRPAPRGNGRPSLRLLPGRGDRGRRPSAHHAQMAGAFHTRRRGRHRHSNDRSQPPFAGANVGGDDERARSGRCGRSSTEASARGGTGSRGPSRADGDRSGVDPDHRPGQDPVHGRAPAGPNLFGPADRHRAFAQGGQARGVEGHRRIGGRAAGRTAGQGRLEGEPQGPGSDARRSAGRSRLRTPRRE